MKGMPLPHDFVVNGVLEFVEDFSSSSNPLIKLNKQGCFGASEPTSVLDTFRSPSPPTSTSTLSSSLGSGGGGGGGSDSTDTAAVVAVSGNPSQKWPPTQQETSSSSVGVDLELRSVPPSLEIGSGGATAGAEKCGLGMEDWVSVLSESAAATPSQEQSILRWIMGDVDDPSIGLNKMLQMGGPPPDYDFNCGFGGGDHSFGLDPFGQITSPPINLLNPSLPTNKFTSEKTDLPPHPPSILPSFQLCNPQNPMCYSNNLPPFSLSQQQQIPFGCSDLKPQIFNSQLLINQHHGHRTQNPTFFLPLSHPQQEQHLFMPPPPKRHNPGSLEPNFSIPKSPFFDSEQELYVGRQQPYLQAAKPKMGVEELVHQNQQEQQGLIDQLYKAAELVESENSVLAEGILARLNHQLTPIGKPFYRAAFYCMEALQFILHTSNNMTPSTATVAHSSPFSLIFKIGAYKSFSEISPLVQFANFTCNQALLEVLDGFDRIHIVDFDIGYGVQWASLMQELALRSDGAPSLKITAFASPSTHDQFELGLTQENLNHFASEIGIAFEFEIVSIDVLNSDSWSLPLCVTESEAIAVNLPVGSFSSYQVSLPLVLQFVKQLSPKIVVSVDRCCDRTDLPFPNHVIHVLQSYSNLLESLDAVNVNLDALQKIERFLLQPSIEKIVMDRFRSPEKMQHWRSLFLSSGFSPLTFSNFAESLAECVVKRTPVRGFHVEKRQYSLVLCWQRRELISASAWR